MLRRSLVLTVLLGTSITLPAQVNNSEVAEAAAMSVLDKSRNPQAEYLLLKAKDAAYYGHYDIALKLVKQSIRLDKRVMETQLFAGNLYLQASEGKKALRFYNNAMKLGGESVTIFLKMGSAYMSLGNYETAESYFSRAILLSGNRATSYVMRGEARIETGQLDQALSDFNKAIDLDASLSSAWRGLGRAYMEQGNYRIALEKLNKAVEMNPEDPESLYYRGMANFKSFKLQAACVDFTAAEKLGHRGAKTMMGETCD
jgi:tetratricopeptide (TPR) repeat protein